ncbi:MAG: hypothetical protein ACJAZ3_001543 [Sphingobacteriales bacterium]|jgi:hypothetical protein
MNIQNHIIELLYLNDCVIIPGLGGFVGNEKRAEVNEIVKTVHPPRKKIAFNAKLVDDDGLLIAHVAQREAISVIEASCVVDEYVKSKLNILNKRSYVDIEGVGKIIQNHENNLVFVPKKDHTFLIDTFGLKEVPLSVYKEEKKPVVEAIIRPKTEAERKMSLKWIPYAAAASIILSALIYFNYNHSSENLSLSTLNPFTDTFTNHTETLKVETVSPTEEVVEEVDTEAIPEKVIEVKIEIINYSGRYEYKSLWENVSELEMMDNSGSTKYAVIIASINNESKAQKVAQKWQKDGFNTVVKPAPSIGYYRIALCGFGDKKLATEALKKVKQAITKDAWILTTNK